MRGAGLHGLAAPGHDLDMGNAGTAMRLFTGLLSAQKFDSRLVGDESLMRRPMERVAKPLREMGADVRTREGRPPVEMRGGRRLHGIDYQMRVASAQVKSAILLAALYAEGTTTVTSPAPCRDHSERMLESAGVKIVTEGLTTRIEPPARIASQSLAVPGDFSSAAFFLVAGLLGAAGEGLVLENVGLNPTRTGLLDILRSMGGRIQVENPRMCGAEPVGDLRVHRSMLQGIAVPEALVPLAIDEFPVLFVAAACARGRNGDRGSGRITGERERSHRGNGRRLHGARGGARGYAGRHAHPRARRGAGFGAGEVDSRGDHRIAMAFAVASLRASGPIVVRDTANVATSFPGFVELARSAGLDLEESGSDRT